MIHINLKKKINGRVKPFLMTRDFNWTNSVQGQPIEMLGIFCCRISHLFCHPPRVIPLNIVKLKMPELAHAKSAKTGEHQTQP